MNIHEMWSRVICKCPPIVDRGSVSAGCLAPHGLRSPQTCAQDTKPSQMRKRRCNPQWDHMNKSAYHPVLLYWGKDWLVEYKYTNTCTHAGKLKNRICRCDRCGNTSGLCSGLETALIRWTSMRIFVLALCQWCQFTCKAHRPPCVVS